MRLSIHYALLLTSLLSLLALSSCRDEDYLVPSIREEVDSAAVSSPVVGLYLLNEGNMGSNKASLDYMDIASGIYSRNIYAERNPSAVKELGDVGNDIQVYGGRLYIVVNCSNKLEVLDAASARSLGHVDIPNCRYVRFAAGKAYVSSYVGPVSLSPSDAVRGAVYEVDTATLAVTRVCEVGFQPEGLEVVGNELYVANSGGYMPPNYERHLSVIDIASMSEVGKVDVGLNLHRVRKDRYGRLWVSSRGNYANVASNLFVLENGKDGRLAVIDSMNVPCSNFAIRGDSLYYISAQWDNATMTNTVGYGIVDVAKRRVVSHNFIADGSDAEIATPYGIALHPASGDVYVTDATNYVSSGWLVCYGSDGRRKWRVRTGDIPSSIAFVGASLEQDEVFPTPPSPTDEPATDSVAVNSGLYADVFTAPRLAKFSLSAADGLGDCSWFLLSADDEIPMAQGPSCVVVPWAVGDTMRIELRASSSSGSVKRLYGVVAQQEESSLSPYTAKCYDYMPAPGQFVNALPKYEAGDNAASMAAKAGAALCSGSIVTLGAYGGYVTFGFDHTVPNRPGMADFRIDGNATYSDLSKYGQLLGGSAEPGIVMVSIDSNNNGLPDDEWFELAGSAHAHADSCLMGYEITYRRPDEAHVATPHPTNSFITDTAYVAWSDNRGGQGYLQRNRFHAQDYFPMWVDADELSFRGSLLAPNAIVVPGAQTQYLLAAYAWGYVDSHPNSQVALNSFDISWAIDAHGNNVHLPGADFIRVYTAVSQSCGWLGETSTEVGRAEDLSMAN